MRYNEKVTTEYGVADIYIGSSPVAYQPKPTGDDYRVGYFARWFSMRINGNVATEIDPTTQSQIDSNLYKTVTLNWKISGPRYPKIVNKIIEQTGVEPENRTEIERVKRENAVDLSRTLTNMVEFWRGY
jgi:hypothetical protein